MITATLLFLAAVQKYYKYYLVMSSSSSSSSSSSTTTMTSTTTILWSTQGGRAKACARRTSRILRDYLHYRREQYASTAAGAGAAAGGDNSGDSALNEALDDYYYGTSFDDFGAAQFLNLGSSATANGHTTNGHTTNGHTTNGQNKNQSQSQSPKRLIIMFVSTTGDAEHCDCIQETWKALLQKSIPPNHFSNISIALFSLGDRAYGPNAFCAAGRKLASRMVQLGASLFCNVGYGDDGTPNGGVFYDLDQWIENDFMPKVLVFWGNGKSVSVNKNGLQEQVQVLVPKNSSAMTMTMTMMRKPQSPYKVLLGSDSRPHLNPNSNPMKEEWEMEQYRSHYNKFFSSLCPATAYQYDPKSGYRVDSCPHSNASSTSSSTLSSHQDNKSATGPLIGHVVSNRRLTNKEWNQETRHLQIHIETKTESSKPSRTTTNATKASNPNTITTTTNTTTSTTASTTTPLLPYRAGDIATILPSNPKSIVEKFLSCLPKSIQYTADAPLNLNLGLSITTKITHSTQYRTNFTPWPQHCTLRGLLTFCADIASFPEREDLRSLSYYCHPSHPMGVEQRKKLIALSEVSMSDAALYGDYVIREKRNWADVLFDFDSIRFVPDGNDGNDDDDDDNDDNDGMNDILPSSSFTPLTIEHLLMILSPIMPRHFSIASAPSTSIINGNGNGNENGNDHSSGHGYVETVMGTCGFDLELCVAVVKGKTPHGRMYNGLCSKYLSHRGRNRSTSGSTSGNGNRADRTRSIVRIWIRPGSFGKLPLDILKASSNVNVVESGKRVCTFATPIMCIGAGTGIAPLRSLIHEREAIRQISSLQSNPTEYVKGNDNNNNNDNDNSNGNENANGNELNLTNTSDGILVFGCRKESEDYYYKDEWISLSTNSCSTKTNTKTNNNTNTNIITKDETSPTPQLRVLTAFSQDQKTKIYVQRVIREADDGLLIARHILENGGAVYVAGGAKMARAVKDEILDSLGRYLPNGSSDAKKVLLKLQRAGRFSIEAWS